MGKRYDLAAREFRTVIEGGVLRDIRGMRKCSQVRYVNPGEGFGELFLTWSCREGDAEQGSPQRAADFEERTKQGAPSYCFAASCGPFRVENRYELSDNCLTQRVLVTNCSEGEAELLDFAVKLGCSSDFQWGKPAAQSVIAHHFVAGSGSHSTFYRCDGEGSLLTMLPREKTEFIYYETEDGGVGDGRTKRGVTWLYCLNKQASRKALEAKSRLRIPPKGLTLAPGQSQSFCWEYFLAEDYQDCLDRLVEKGQPAAQSVPGYTVPRGMECFLRLRSRERLAVASDRKDLSIELVSCQELSGKEAAAEGENAALYRLRFEGLGEYCLNVTYEGGYTQLYYFATEDVETLLKKRSAFLTAKQHRNTGKWYEGLLGEWNNETGALLGPDNYDRIKGWRIYEVTCDDPGLSKPAFLSSKLAVDPVQEEVDALEYYVEHFVWGGLQRTEEEPFAYGIYGIPDWKTLRESNREGIDGRLHLWRIYDYPHIALMYYNLYRVASDYPSVQTKLSAKTYLNRAYRTALAMFLIPAELDGWSAYQTGLYNELVIPWIVRALKREKMTEEAARLNRHWLRKAHYFAMECRDVFGSEYPFDTTGFESTYVLAEEALCHAVCESGESAFSREIVQGSAAEFMEKQQNCNVACRGVLEPSYFWYGSDYRGDNMHYLLSYMSQMGGYSLLQYALYRAKEPFGLLRLAYGSVLSSYALLNTGTSESNFGWWFPGKENDGCACGGFEPQYLGETWLEQAHQGGAWYYSCEIDLGFCGGIRSAAAVLAQDPQFGEILYGGERREEAGKRYLSLKDGVRRQFHYLGKNGERLHICFDSGKISARNGIEIGPQMEYLKLWTDVGSGAGLLRLRVQIAGMGSWYLEAGQSAQGADSRIREIPGGEWIELELSPCVECLTFLGKDRGAI
ncbi:MAG: DUF5695 domain-containing protein [Eubacteriales bacterium]|nr:DUF5695 domain-containing protein [Eubacteriales bacterium]